MNNSCEKVIEVISRFESLQELKLVNIVRKSSRSWLLPYSPRPEGLLSMFSKWKQTLTQITVGDWATNETMAAISKTLANLTRIRVIGNAVDDAGLEFVLK